MGSVVCSRGMAVFIAMVAPTMRTRPAAALELTGNKSFLQEILPYYSFCEGFLEGGGGGNATGSSSSLCAKTLQIFFDTSIMKFFFESKSACPLGVAAEPCYPAPPPSYFFVVLYFADVISQLNAKPDKFLDKFFPSSSSLPRNLHSEDDTSPNYWT